MIDADEIKKWLGVITAAFTVIGGGYTAIEKTSLFKKPNPILTWAPEYFSISNGSVTERFSVIVAREKHRDDCKVEDFKLEIRDSSMMIHTVTPSITKFSGPASPKIDKFGYKISIDNPESVSLGKATLLAHINYKCPEGEIIVNYPDHKNLNFEIVASN